MDFSHESKQEKGEVYLASPFSSAYFGMLVTRKAVAQLGHTKTCLAFCGSWAKSGPKRSRSAYSFSFSKLTFGSSMIVPSGASR